MLVLLLKVFVVMFYAVLQVFMVLETVMLVM